MKKKYLAWMLSVAMVLGMLPGQAFAAGDDAVTLDLGDGSIVITETGYTQGAAAEETPHTGSYVIEKEYVEVTTNTVTVSSGTVNMTLASDIHIDVGATSGACAFSVAPGADLTLTLDGSVVLKSGSYRAGLEVPTGASLTVRASSRFDSLDATGGMYGAGIGGYNTANSSTNAKAAGNITVESGRVTGRGGQYAAGIGGGYYARGTETDEAIHVLDGTVIAIGGEYAAGIGGGYYRTAGSILIEGGKITAQGGTTGSSSNGCSGIGSGYKGAQMRDGEAIRISGGTVTATGGGNGAGIGGGAGGSLTVDIVIEGTADVTATGSGGGAGIGGGGGADIVGNITISDGTVTATGGSGGGAGIGGGYRGDGTGEGKVIRISGGTVIATGSGGAGIGGGIAGSDNGGHGTGIDGAIIIEGDANVTATGVHGAGIGGGRSYRISTTYYYGHGTGTGGQILITDDARVTAVGMYSAAGIGGGGYYYNANDGQINGGAGTGEGGSIVISGNAEVTAESRKPYSSDRNHYGSGIGGGYRAKGTGTDGLIRITDNATVTAVGGSGSYTAGIGGEYGTGTRGRILIDVDPVVEATGYYAGIGGSDATSDYGAIYISGGTVKATATYTGSSSRGIGGYYSGTGGTVNITGGNVTATGYYAMSAANLYGGVITAEATYSNATSAFSATPASDTSSYPWIFADPACPVLNQGVVFSGTEGQVCGDFYWMKEDREIPAGHTLTVAAGQELVIDKGATLTVNGKLIVEGTLTIEDGDLLCSEGGSAEGNVPHEHDLLATAAKAASCDSDGCLAYWTCTVCGGVFADADATQSTAAEAVILPATGHNMVDNVCTVCGLEVTEASVLLPTVTGRPGDTVRVPVSLANNPGIISAKITVTFDTQKLTLTKAEDGGLLEGNLFTDKLTSPYVLTWEKGDQTADNTKNGTLAVLTFKIKDSAAEGVSPITATASDAFSAELGPVTFSVTDGGVNVMRYFPGDANSDGVVDLLDVTVLRRFIAAWKDVTVDETASDVNCDGAVGLDDAVILRRYIAGWEGYDLPYEAAQSYSRVRLSGGSPVFAVSRAVGRPGDLVTVDVTLQGNPGIVAAQLTVSYDDTQLELVEAADTGVLPGAIFGDTLASPYKLTWEDGTSADVTADAVVARLTFRVLEGCGGEVAVTVSEGSGHNFELSRVSFAGEPGAVYGNVSADYEGGKIAVNNLPEDMLAMAAAYEDGRMVWVSDVTDSSAISVPSAARNADLWIFFLQDGWKPVGAAQQLN